MIRPQRYLIKIFRKNFIFSFSSKWGTLRSVYATLDAGVKYWCPDHGDVIHFRLEKRQELMLDFSALKPSTVLAVAGK